jgi:hypothetical protein
MFLPDKLAILLDILEARSEVGLVARQAIPVDEGGKREHTDRQPCAPQARRAMPKNSPMRKIISINLDQSAKLLYNPLTDQLVSKGVDQ